MFVSEAENQRSDSGAFDSYALSLVCTLEAGRLSLDFRFDSRVVDRDTIERAAHHLEHLVKRLCTPELDQTPLGEITLTTDRDLNQIWKWNAEDFARVDACVHDLVSQTVRAHPQAVAVSAWDGEVRYHELDAVSTVLAARLVEMGVVRNTVVPLVFEKSMYAMVALLSVLKAGAGVLLLDSTLPESRLQAIITQTNPAVVVSSVANQARTSRLVQPTTKTMSLGPEIPTPHYEARPARATCSCSAASTSCRASPPRTSSTRYSRAVAPAPPRAARSSTAASAAPWCTRSG